MLSRVITRRSLQADADGPPGCQWCSLSRSEDWSSMVCLGAPHALVLKPRLEHENVPERVYPVAPSRQVFLPHAANWRRIEESFLPQSAGIEKFLGPLSQRPPNPFMNRDAKARFGPVYQLAGYVFVQYLSEQPLGLAFSELHCKRQPRSKLDDSMIQEGRPGLQADPMLARSSFTRMSSGKYVTVSRNIICLTKSGTAAHRL